jgi:hypothetical protein
MRPRMRGTAIPRTTYMLKSVGVGLTLSCIKDWALAKKAGAVSVSMILCLGLVVGVLFYHPYVAAYVPPPACSPALHWTESSASESLDMLPSNSISPDASTVYYPEAYDYHAAVNTASQQCSAVPLTYGLVGYWPLDEGSGTSAYDLSHNNDTGTLVNSPTWESGANCKFDGCLKFVNSTNDFVLIPHSSSLQIMNAITMSVWVYQQAQSCGHAWYRFFGQLGGYWMIYSEMYGCDWHAAIVTANGTYYYPTIHSVVLNSWVNLGFTYNGSILTTYYDCASTGTTTLNQSIYPSTNGISLGGMENFDSLQGSLDDARIYNYALSASQMSELCQSTVPVLEQPSSTTQSVYTYYLQQPQTITSGNAYTSLGQTYTASVTGTYWVDEGTTSTYRQAFLVVA